MTDLTRDNANIRNQNEQLQNQVTDLVRRLLSAENSNQEKENQVAALTQNIANITNQLDQLGESQIETLRKELLKRGYDWKDKTCGVLGVFGGLYLAELAAGPLVPYCLKLELELLDFLKVGNFLTGTQLLISGKNS